VILFLTKLFNYFQNARIIFFPKNVANVHTNIFAHTYAVTSAGGVKATLVALPSEVLEGKSIELRVTAGLGEPGCGEN
jgi:hypothetical protein